MHIQLFACKWLNLFGWENFTLVYFHVGELLSGPHLSQVKPSDFCVGSQICWPPVSHASLSVIPWPILKCSLQQLAVDEFLSRESSVRVTFPFQSKSQSIFIPRLLVWKGQEENIDFPLKVFTQLPPSFCMFCCLRPRRVGKSLRSCILGPICFVPKGESKNIYWGTINVEMAKAEVLEDLGS